MRAMIAARPAQKPPVSRSGWSPGSIVRRTVTPMSVLPCSRTIKPTACMDGWSLGTSPSMTVEFVGALRTQRMDPP